MVTGGWITQADRSGWQQRAAAELAAILAAHPDIPVLAWTVTASGGALAGRSSPPPRAGAACSGNGGGHWGWARRPRTPSAGGAAIYLHARGVCGGVVVSVTATVFDDGEDSW